jgi:hypothetical protein
MDIKRYEVFEETHFSYYFFSEGPKGKIKKQILFKESGIKNYDQLSYGDIDSNGNFKEDVVSDNWENRKIIILINNMMRLFLKLLKQKNIYNKSCPFDNN